MNSDGLKELRRRYPWPDTKPGVEVNPHGWFDPGIRSVCAEQITDDMDVILELGTWTGFSARWFCKNSQAAVICVDHWKGSNEHKNNPKFAPMLPTLYETFLATNWHLQDRLIPVKANTLDAMREVADLGIRPGLVMVDAAHDEESVFEDVTTAVWLFPDAAIVGHDATWKGVAAGAGRAADATNRLYVDRGTCYEIRPKEV